MIRTTRRLLLALFSVLAIATAAAAHEPGRGYAERDGYDYSYEAGSASGYERRTYDEQTYEGDRYGGRFDTRGGGYEEGYAYSYGDDGRDRYDRVDTRRVVDAGPPPCDWRRPAEPRDPYACPPGYGVVTLPGSFFYGGGGVGPEYIARGGGGGYGYAYAGASAGAYAYASASASARVSIGGRRGGGHKPGKGGGCGCR